jgi:hypothetical protein
MIITEGFKYSRYVLGLTTIIIIAVSGVLLTITTLVALVFAILWYKRRTNVPSDVRENVVLYAAAPIQAAVIQAAPTHAAAQRALPTPHEANEENEYECIPENLPIPESEYDNTDNAFHYDDVRNFNRNPDGTEYKNTPNVPGSSKNAVYLELLPNA